jgi:hypothetical protein
MPKQLETIIMLPDELNTIIGKRTKSTNDSNPIKFRSCTKPSSQTQCRNSELELIFQVKNFSFLPMIYLLFFLHQETCTTKRTKSAMTYFLYTCVYKLKNASVNRQ